MKMIDFEALSREMTESVKRVDEQFENMLESVEAELERQRVQMLADLPDKPKKV